MNPALPNIDYSVFNTESSPFLEIYRDAVEERPWDSPIPRGNPVTMTAFVDASHRSNKMTGRSHTGYVIFLNKAPILWYSKRQQTVETSAFLSEFIALRVCIEAIRGLRYKLRMFGIPILNEEPTYVFCDNESVVKNCSRVESVLNKKHSSLAYHYARWSVAAGETMLGWIHSEFNIADAFTKRLSPAKMDDLFWR